MPEPVNEPKPAGGIAEIFAAFLKLGLTSFGGPIAHLGYFDFADLFAVIGALEIILIANGHPVKLGAGVAAVQEVYAEAAGIRAPVNA